MKKILQLWNEYRFPKSFRNEKEYQIHVLRLVLVSALLVLTPFLVIGLFGLVNRSSISLKVQDGYLTFAIICVGLYLVSRERISLARYIFVFSVFMLGLLHTANEGIDSIFSLYYVVALVGSFMILKRRINAVLVVIVVPVIIEFWFHWGSGYKYGGVLSYLGFLTGISLLLEINNRLLQIFKDERNLVMEVEKVRTAGTSVMTSLDLQETIRRILDQLTKIVPHDSACVLLMKGDDVMEIVGGRGWENVDEVLGLRFAIPGDNPNTVVMETGKAHILGNAPEEYPEFLKEPHNHIKSWLGVPLIRDGNLIGMMAIDSTEPNYFSEDHIRVVSSYADHVAVAIENSLLYELTNQAVKRRAILHQASQDVIKASADLEEIYLAIHTAASRLMPCEVFAVSLVKEEIIEGVYLIDKGERFENVINPKESGLTGKVIRTNSSIMIEDYVGTDELLGVHFGEEDHIRSLVAVPLVIGDDVIGMITAQSYNAFAYDDEDLTLLEMLGATAAISIKNAQLLAEVEHLARTDSLTGLLNRRAFDEKLVYEISRAARYNYSLSLLMIDVDDFKQFNDKFGHSKGDEHLKMVSTIIVQNVRSPDMVARIGGEEFTVILPHTSKQGGVKLAERVRKAIMKEFVQDEHPGSTVSIGVATYPGDATSIKQLYIAADKAMFAAKDKGKNKVVPAVSAEGVK